MDTKQLKQKILDLAIRGKLVPQDPNDEPASVLLERIRKEKEQLIASGKLKKTKSKTTDTPHYENVPFEIPASWEWTTIGDIAESNIGLTYDPSEICSNGVPVLRSNNIKNERIVLKDLVRVNSKILDKQFLNEGDLLICARNGSRNLVGKCAIIEHLSEPSSFGAFMAVCRSSYNRWLYYLLQTDYFDRYLDDSNSTTINQVTQKMLLAFRIPFPPCTEQLKIETEIEKWFSIIDEIEANKQDLQEYIKQAKSKVLDLAIHGKLVPQDPNDEPAIDLLKRINPSFKPCDTSHYENLPSGWCISSLKDAGIEILNGYAFQSKNYVPNGIKVIRITNVQDGYIVDDDPKYYPISSKGEIGRYLLHENDLLMSLTGNVGRVGFLQKELLPAALNQRVGCIRGTEQVISKKYLYYFLQSDLFKADCIDSAKGVAQLNISTEWLKAYEMPIPPIEEQIRISTKIEQIFTAIDTITAEL